MAAAGLALVLLQGCATGPNANRADPLEPFNRVMFNFNDGVDRAILKPVATAYRDVTPSHSVRHFNLNLPCPHSRLCASAT